MWDFVVPGVSPAESRSAIQARLITLATFHPRCLAKSRVDGDWEWGGGVCREITGASGER